MNLFFVIFVMNGITNIVFRITILKTKKDFNVKNALFLLK
jgi:hypothetical protein